MVLTRPGMETGGNAGDWGSAPWPLAGPAAAVADRLSSRHAAIDAAL